MKLLIYGATSLIGNDLVVLLDERQIQGLECILVGDLDSVGEVYKIGGVDAVVRKEEDVDPDKFDVIIVAGEWPAALNGVRIAGRIIDASGMVYRERPLAAALAGVNLKEQSEQPRALRVPLASVGVIASSLAAIDSKFQIKRVVATLQLGCAVAGKNALDELWEQIRAVYTQKEVPIDVFGYQLAFNAVPRVGAVSDSGATSVEERFRADLCEVLGRPDLAVAVTAIRIPVFHADGVALSIECSRECEISEVSQILSHLPGVHFVSEPEDTPTAIDVTSVDEVRIGRLRRDNSVKHGFLFWAVADGVRTALARSALDLAVQMAGRSRQ